ALEARLKGRLRHRVANPVRHEPRALVGHAEHPMQLMRAHALLARTEEVEREQPLVQRNVRALEDRADRDRVLLPASGALVELPCLRFEWVWPALTLAAVRADGTVRPADRL